VSRELALNVDLAATLLARAGAPISDLDGRDLYAITARGRSPGSAGWRSQFVYLGPYLPQHRPDVLALRAREWKYVRLVGDQLEEQFFDLSQDPGERWNLAFDPAHAGRLSDARQQLVQAVRQLGIPEAWLEPGAGRRSKERSYSR
jgi:arylsulfatase A-like enzyme